MLRLSAWEHYDETLKKDYEKARALLGINGFNMAYISTELLERHENFLIVEYPGKNFVELYTTISLTMS